MLRKLHIVRDTAGNKKKQNEITFDDLLPFTLKLFEKHKDVRKYYQNRFQYISVDEYQDTNKEQADLLRILSYKYKNLCVIGDPNQAIYAFRGATIENFFNFKKEYPSAIIIQLNKNYRSTETIIRASDALISHTLNHETPSEAHILPDLSQCDGARRAIFQQKNM